MIIVSLDGKVDNKSSDGIRVLLCRRCWQFLYTRREECHTTKVAMIVVGNSVRVWHIIVLLRSKFCVALFMAGITSISWLSILFGHDRFGKIRCCVGRSIVVVVPVIALLILSLEP